MTNNLPRFSPRLWLWVALAALLLLNYQTWMHDYGPPPGAVAGSPATNAAPHAAAPASDLGSRIPEAPRTATAAAANKANLQTGVEICTLLLEACPAPKIAFWLAQERKCFPSIRASI